MGKTVVANKAIDAMMARWARQMPYVDVVALDPLMNLHEAQENDNAQMNHVMRIIRDTIARRYNVAVLLATHTGKDPTRATTARGASAIEGVPRLNFTLTHVTGRPTLTIQQTKNTFGKEIPPYELSRMTAPLKPNGPQYPLFVFGTTTSAALTAERDKMLLHLIRHMDEAGITSITQTDAAIAIANRQHDFGRENIRARKLKEWLGTNFVSDGLDVHGKPMRTWLTIGSDSKILLRHT
jgi:AAA domain